MYYLVHTDYNGMAAYLTRCGSEGLYRDADKSLARPGRKQATVTKP